MRVDGPLPIPENARPDKVTGSGSSTQPSRSAPVNSGQDSTQLSVDAQTVQQLKTALTGTPEVRQERVNALRQTVAKGQYKISDQQLSDAIASELGG